VFRFADWIEMWCSPITLVTSERMPARSSPSACRATRNELSAVGAHATSTSRSGWDRSACAFVQSLRWTDTPLSRVTKPMISSPGTGRQQRASFTHTFGSPWTTTPASFPDPLLLRARVMTEVSSPPSSATASVPPSESIRRCTTDCELMLPSPIAA